MSMVKKTRVPIGLPKKKEHPNPTAFDILTRLVLPIALVVIAGSQEQRFRFLALLVLALLSLVIGFYHIGVRQVRNQLNKLHDRRFARRTFPKFRRFVHRLGELLDTTRSDTLEYVARERLCRSNAAHFESLRMVPLDLFNGFWHDLDSRIDKQKLSLGNFVQSASELRNLVNSYNRYCVSPVFERLPQELSELLTDEARSSLGSLRERFVRFLEDYDEYAKELEESLRTVHLRAFYISRPKPL